MCLLCYNKSSIERERERVNFKILLFFIEYVEIMDNGVNFFNLCSVNIFKF